MKKNTYTGGALMIGVVLFVLFSLVGQVQAVEYSPISIDLEVNPDSTQEGEIKLRNLGEKVKEYTVEVLPFGAKENEAGVPDFVNTGLSEQENKFTDWIWVESDRIKLDSGQTKFFKYRINIPPNAPPWRLLFWNVVQRVRSKNSWPK